MFANYFSMVSNKVEERLWLYSVCFLNYLFFYEEVHCYVSLYRSSNNFNVILSSSVWKVFISYAGSMICLSCLFIRSSDFIPYILHLSEKNRTYTQMKKITWCTDNLKNFLNVKQDCLWADFWPANLILSS